jgi:hypothetical protein
MYARLQSRCAANADALTVAVLLAMGGQLMVAVIVSRVGAAMEQSFTRMVRFDPGQWREAPAREASDTPAVRGDVRCPRLSSLEEGAS